jgi:hypothetical protein
MANFFDLMLTWLGSHQNILGWAGLFSLIMIFATLLTVPLIIVSLPSRYLNEKNDRLSEIKSIWRWPYLIFKKMLGVLLVLAGLTMLVLPGQGLLMLAIGIVLMNFPGKRSLIRRLIGQQRILRAINRLRHRANKKPVEAPTGTTGD